MWPLSLVPKHKPYERIEGPGWHPKSCNIDLSRRICNFAVRAVYSFLLLRMDIYWILFFLPMGGVFCSIDGLGLFELGLTELGAIVRGDTLSA
jgi:hypothetical protein